MSDRPSVSAGIKRQVRKRCGFGCVICGVPIYEYEHMLEWAIVKRHVAEEITLLCPTHHTEKTKGLLPLKKLAAANIDPFNKRIGSTKNYPLHYDGTTIKMILGNSEVSYSNIENGKFVIPLLIDNDALIYFNVEDDQIFVNLNMFNSNNDCVFQVIANEIIINLENWDVEWVGLKLTIRENLGNILLEIIFNVPSEINITRAKIFRNGIEILIDSGNFFLVNNSVFFRSLKVSDSFVGIAIGVKDPSVGGVGIWLGDVQRSGFDRAEAFKFMKRAKRKFLNL